MRAPYGLEIIESCLSCPTAKIGSSAIFLLLRCRVGSQHLGRGLSERGNPLRF